LVTNPNQPVPTHTPSEETTPTLPTGSTVDRVRPITVSSAQQRGALDYILAAALVVAIGGVAFAVGRTTAPAQARVPNSGAFVGPIGSLDPGAGGPGPGFGGAFAGGGLTIEGTVKSVDGSTLVIGSTNGQEVTVTLGADTTYHEATSVDAGSVAAGDDVTVRVSGGGQFGGGGAGPGASGTPSFTATDVTVVR
jgi:hypothetical protein